MTQGTHDFPFHIHEMFCPYDGAMSSPLAELNYDGPSRDLVRFRDDDLDDAIAAIVSDALRQGDLATFRRSLDEGDSDLLTTFAHRRIVTALRTSSHDALTQAYDAYALMPVINEAEFSAWFKGGLMVAATCAMDIAILHQRFLDIAPPSSADIADVLFRSTDRLESFAQCFLVETSTPHGKGLLNTVVNRDETGWGNEFGSLTGIAPDLAPFRSGYDTAGHIASVAAALADAFDAIDGHVTDAIRHDQLVASSFDIVTGGSFLRTRACVGFFVTGPDGLDFSVVVADIDPDVTGHSALELAQLADELVDQAAVARDTVLVLLSVVPNFDDLFNDSVVEGLDDEEDVNDDPVGHYLEMVSGVLATLASFLHATAVVHEVIEHVDTEFIN